MISTIAKNMVFLRNGTVACACIYTIGKARLDFSALLDFIFYCNTGACDKVRVTRTFGKARLQHLERGGESDFFNLGNEKGTSVLELIDSVKRVTGREFTVILSDRRAGDPAKLVGSSEKAQRILGWKPQYAEVDVIVKHAWNWHENKQY